MLEKMNGILNSSTWNELYNKDQLKVDGRINEKGIGEVRKQVTFPVPVRDVFLYISYLPNIRLINKYVSEMRLVEQISP
jgi:hypothetical protein